MQKAVREGTIKRIKINDIIIGDRIRKDFADMEHFALSLQQEGMHSPIIVDIAEGGKYNLIEGERRIRANKMNGETKIDALTFQGLSAIRRKEIELLHCVQRQDLHFIEEAIATKQIIEERRRLGSGAGLARYGRNITNKEVAVELSMSEARMSENLRIADAVHDHPEIEAKAFTRSRFLKQIRSGGFKVRDNGEILHGYKENFIITTPLGCVETINDKIVDLAILHPDKVDVELFKEVHKRLKTMGQIIVFCSYQECAEWENLFKNNGMNVGMQPYIWQIKGTSEYQNFIWAGKNLTSPIRPMLNLLSAGLPPKSMHRKAKPMQLTSDIVKNCTERGAFILIPDCYDIESLRACMETERNVRAATSNKILRDKLILSITKEA
jgi:ParB/RepB/Spo0J family partition protein